jgi:hypothetical protein
MKTINVGIGALDLCQPKRLRVPGRSSVRRSRHKCRLRKLTPRVRLTSSRMITKRKEYRAQNT